MIILLVCKKNSDLNPIVWEDFPNDMNGDSLNPDSRATHPCPKEYVEGDKLAGRSNAGVDGIYPL